MPVSVSSSAQAPVVVVASVRVEVDAADAEAKEAPGTTIAAVMEKLTEVGDVIVTANTRDGASASVSTAFAFDLGFGSEVVYSDEVAP